MFFFKVAKNVKELGVQDPVGFWDPAGGACLCNICVVDRLVSDN